jgi:mono/diheme cytochrome c family protein
VIRLALAALVLAAASRPPKRTAHLVEKGKAVYELRCVFCHGPTGAGDGVVAPTLNPKPRNFRTEPFVQGDKPADIVKTLATGVPNTGMARFPMLSEEESWAVAFYVLELRGKQH